jgi:hypothetical protein
MRKNKTQSLKIANKIMEYIDEDISENNLKSKVEVSFQSLKNIASEYGYSLVFSTTYYNSKIKSGSAVDHGRKVLITMPRITEREIIGICHEIGHIIDRQKNDKKRNRNIKIIRMYEEILAWLYAIPYLIRFKTPLYLTIHSIYFALHSHFKYKRKLQ